jgi:class 3 adenylate cyclase
MARIQCKLAAILAANVQFSKLMGGDEAGTLDDLRACGQIVDSIIAEHHSRIFGTVGDSVVAEFASAVWAVSLSTPTPSSAICTDMGSNPPRSASASAPMASGHPSISTTRKATGSSPRVPFGMSPVP